MNRQAMGLAAMAVTLVGFGGRRAHHQRAAQIKQPDSDKRAMEAAAAKRARKAAKRAAEMGSKA